MTWHASRLGDVLTLKRGHDLPDSERQDGDVPVVSSSGITGRHSESKAKSPGVVTGRYGTLGEVFYVEEDYWPLNTALYVVDFKGNHPRFAAYFLQNVLKNYQSDKAAVPGVNRNVLHELKVRYPDRKIQEAIVDILSAYDDLIENNRRRMTLLGDAARQLYREWFVRLRFPGHEHTRITNGVPEGWERKTIRELVTIHRGKSYRSSELAEAGGKPFANLKCVERFGGFRSSGLKRFIGDYKRHHVALPGDILVAVTDLTRDAMVVSRAARLPKLAGEAVFSMDLVKLIPNDNIEREWLYMLLRYSSFADEVREEASGTTVLHLKPKHIGSWCAIVPAKVLRHQFSLIVRNFLEHVDSLEVANTHLRIARDLLLPRLMSGENAV